MAIPIQMPSLSPTMTEGKITKWLKKEGDKVSSGTAIAEVETDKSNLEVEAYDDGFLIAILTKEGESAKVGAPIAYIGEKGEKVDTSKAAAPAAADAAKAASATAPAPSQPTQAVPPPAAPKPPPAATKPPPPPPGVGAQKPAAQVVQLHPSTAQAGSEGRVLSSPLARKMAEQSGLDLHSVSGSGPSGRIIKRDIE